MQLTPYMYYRQCDLFLYMYVDVDVESLGSWLKWKARLHIIFEESYTFIFVTSTSIIYTYIPTHAYRQTSNIIARL